MKNLKKILKSDRLMESMVNKQLANTPYFQKYTAFVTVFKLRGKDEEEYNKIANLFDEIFQFPLSVNMKGHRRYEYGDDLFTFFIYKTDNFNNFNWGWDIIEYLDHDMQIYNGVYLRKFNMNDINTKEKIENILYKVRDTPDYAPKKFIRTLESLSELSAMKNKLSKGKYNCINFIVDNDYDRKRVHNYLASLDIFNNLQILYDTDDMCYTIFTVYNDYFNQFIAFRPYNSGDGEHMIDGDFKRWTNDIYNISPLFSVDEFINYIKKNTLNASDMYKPRHINRTLEGVNNSLYKSVGIKMNNEAEKDHIEKALIKKGINSFNGKKISVSIYPQLVWVDSEDSTYSYSDVGKLRENQIAEYIAKRNHYRDFDTNPHIFSYTDVDNIENILKFGDIKPSYTSRKIDRDI